MAGILGGYVVYDNHVEVLALVNGHVAAINAHIGKNYSGFVINSVHRQLVNGHNYFVHLTTNDGHKLSVTIHVPHQGSGEPVRVIDVHEGHHQPHHHHH